MTVGETVTERDGNNMKSKKQVALRTSIRIPKYKVWVVETIDKYAKRIGRTRNHLYVKAITLFAQKIQEEDK